MSAATAIASSPKKGRKSASLPSETVEYLKSWMMSPEHISHPYPTDQEKADIMAATGIELKQLTNWFVNNRKRFWKPRVEAKLLTKFPTNSHASAPALGRGGLSRSVLPIGTTAPVSKLLDNISVHCAPQVHRGNSSFGVAIPASSLDRCENFAPARPETTESANSAALDREEDFHTISDGGSASSTCNSDDESMAASSTSIPPATFGASLGQHIYSQSPPFIAAAPSGSPLRPEGSISGNVEPLHGVAEGCADLPSWSVSTESSNVHGMPQNDAAFVTPLNHCQTHCIIGADLEQDEISSNPPSRKRARTDSGTLLKGDDEWRYLCRNAKSAFCESLPGLEDAARMFGYVSH